MIDAAQNPTGLRPIGEDKPTRIRDTDINTVYSTFQNIRANDPNREKREMLLESFCRYPYANEKDRCLIEGYSANFGEFHYKIRDKIQVAVDFLTERPSAFTIKTTYRDPKLDPESADTHSTRHSELITTAFERFFIKKWDKWTYNIQMDSFYWNMYGKAIEYWDDPACPYSRSINPKDFFPDQNATMFPDDWDTVYIKMDLYAWDLWQMAQKDKAQLWDKESLIYVLKYALKQDKWQEDAILKGFNNYALDYSLQSRQLSVVVMLVREYDPEGGKQISKYIFSEQWPAGGNTKKNKGFLFRQPFAFENFSKAFCMLSDQVGTGYYYNNPSFGELIYVACFEYERLLNRIMHAVDLSMMLMFKTQDANAGDKIRNNILQDSIIMAPGTEAQQVAIRLPTGEAGWVMQKVQSDLARGTSNYEIGTPNPAGGTTPVTAQQNRQDANQALRAESMYLKWMNHGYGTYGEELYSRFVTDRSGPTEKNLKAFEKWLEERDVPKECWEPDNVEIVSTGMQGAGNPQQRFDAAIGVMDVLSRTPMTAGEAKAQRDAVAALVGADKVDDYIGKQKEFATEQDRIISMENAALNTEPATPVRPDDAHILHFQGHIISAGKDIESAAAYLQSQANEIDKGIDLNETARSLMHAQFKMAHASIHLQYIQRDSRHANLVRKFSGDIADLVRQAEKIEAVANQVAAKREEQIAQLNGTDPEVEKQKALAEIEVNKQQQLSEIATGKAITQAQVQEDLAKQRSSVETEIKMEKAASEIAIDQTKEAIKLDSAQTLNDLKRRTAEATLESKQRKAKTAK
jgi:hypothetical protein